MITRAWLRGLPHARLAFLRKETRATMKLPIETKPALWGAAGGAIALAIPALFRSRRGEISMGFPSSVWR